MVPKPSVRWGSSRSAASPSDNPLLSGLGLTLLLLAASPMRDVVGSTMSPNGFRCFGPDAAWSATPVLHYFASSSNAFERPRQLSAGRAVDGVSDSIDDDDEEEVKRRRRGGRRAPYLVAKDGVADGTSTEADSLQIISDEAGSVDCDFEAEGLSRLDDGTMELVLTFLNLPELAACRRVRRRWADYANAVAPLPIPGAVFLRYRRDTNRGQFDALPRTATRWQCPSCRRSQTVGAACAHCGCPNADPAALRRLFLGQLRKERTVEVTDWLLAMLRPELRLAHVENHTNPKDGRGKGCVWAFVRTEEEEASILSLNKRLFMDVDEAGNEGFWFVHPDCLGTLAEFAVSQAYITHRPLTLPRQPFVAERPAGARLAPPRYTAPPRCLLPPCPAYGSGPFQHHASSRHPTPAVDGGIKWRHNPYDWAQAYEQA